MTMKSLGEILSEHLFFQDLPPDNVEFISGCGKNVVFRQGALIAEEGAAANEFYVIRSGTVSIETHVPQKGSTRLQTLKAGDILGWSWLFPPYRWTFDSRALDTVHAIALNGKCLREKCEKDTALGYRLMKKFSQIMTERLRATRLQLLDIYAPPPAARLRRSRPQENVRARRRAK